ncbi:MAG: DEAD/DEAH box helicase, partial [Lentisphaeria bacterium]|nr:DEAD/DEAH box helicase [Lentisphaeria bacterium]
MQQIIGDRVTHLYGHQERAIRSIREGRTTLVSTGTGSGKTECFLYPIISRCLDLRDAGEAPGISAVLVYPMNALAEDQLDRLRGLLAGSGISFGMYVGKTPQLERLVSGHRLDPGSTRADYEAVLQRYRQQGRADSVHPAEEVCSREVMRTAGQQPRILLTNVKQLELLLTRQTDIEMFDNCRLDFLVFDEAHTFGGIQGAETACLIRRLRAFCGRSERDTVCVATSATIVDARDQNAGARFASRFFGTPVDQVESVHEEYEADPWTSDRRTPISPSTNLTELLTDTLSAVDHEEPDAEIRSAYQLLTGEMLSDGDWRVALHDALLANETAFVIRSALEKPRSLMPLLDEVAGMLARPISEEEVLTYLALGAAAFKQGRPVYRPVVHGYVRGIPGGVVTFPNGQDVKLWLSSEEELHQDSDRQLWRVPVHTCTTCGQHYYVAWLRDFEFTASEPAGGQLAENGSSYWQALDKDHGGKRTVLLDQV